MEKSHHQMLDSEYDFLHNYEEDYTDTWGEEDDFDDYDETTCCHEWGYKYGNYCHCAAAQKQWELEQKWWYCVGQWFARKWFSLLRLPSTIQYKLQRKGVVNIVDDDDELPF